MQTCEEVQNIQNPFVKIPNKSLRRKNMHPYKMWKFQKNFCRTPATRSDNRYKHSRMRFVRLMRKYENRYCGDEMVREKAESSIRHYIDFVSMKHLMKKPALAGRFERRMINNHHGVKLLNKQQLLVSRRKAQPRNIRTINTS